MNDKKIRALKNKYLFQMFLINRWPPRLQNFTYMIYISIQIDIHLQILCINTYHILLNKGPGVHNWLGVVIKVFLL